MRAKAEEVKTRVIAELKARELAQVEEDARYRQEAAVRARSAAEDRRKREDEARNAAVAVRKPPSWPKTVAIALVALIGVAVAALHFVPLNGYIAGARQVLSQRLGVPVDISELRYALLPSPKLTLQGVALGSLQEVKIGSVVVAAGPFALLADTKELDDVEVNNLTADQDALALAARWAVPPSGSQSLVVRKVRLKGTRLALREFEAPPFDGDITLGANGAVQRVQLASTGLRVDVTQKDGGWRATLDGRNWQAPLGPAVTFDDLNVVAIFGPKQVTLTSIEGKAGRGTVKGTAKATWGSGVRVDGEFSLTGGDLASLMTAFTRDFSATGNVTANGSIALQAPSLKTVFADPKVDATFTVERGELNNVDIVRAVQSPARDGVRGGKTRFDSLEGTLQASDKIVSYRGLRARLRLDERDRQRGRGGQRRSLRKCRRRTGLQDRGRRAQQPQRDRQPQDTDTQAIERREARDSTSSREPFGGGMGPPESQGRRTRACRLPPNCTPALPARHCTPPTPRCARTRPRSARRSRPRTTSSRACRTSAPRNGISRTRPGSSRTSCSRRSCRATGPFIRATAICSIPTTKPWGRSFRACSVAFSRVRPWRRSTATATTSTPA